MVSKADKEVATGADTSQPRQTRSSTKGGNTNQEQASKQTNTKPTQPASKPNSGTKAPDKPGRAEGTDQGRGVAGALKVSAEQVPTNPEFSRTRTTTPEHQEPEGDDEPEEDQEHEGEGEQEEEEEQEEEQEEEEEEDEEQPASGNEEAQRKRIQELEEELQRARQQEATHDVPMEEAAVDDTSGANRHQSEDATPVRRKSGRATKNAPTNKGLQNKADKVSKKAQKKPEKSINEYAVEQEMERRMERRKLQEQDLEKSRAMLLFLIQNENAMFRQMLQQDGNFLDMVQQEVYQASRDNTAVLQESRDNTAAPQLSRRNSNVTMRSAPDPGDSPPSRASPQARGLEPPQQSSGHQREDIPQHRASEPPQFPGRQREDDPQRRASEPPQPPGRQRENSTRNIGAQAAVESYRRKKIWFYDPEKLEWKTATIYGRMRQRGRMAVELPSLNPDYPDCPRRYNVRCKDYDVKWNTLKPLAGIADWERLEFIRDTEDCFGKFDGHRPDVTGVISSPSYAGGEPQDPPLLNFELWLPEDKEWHSKTDSQRVFGDYSEQMEIYLYKSGEAKPKLPRPVYHREHLQALAMKQEGAEAGLKSLDQRREEELTELKAMRVKLGNERINEILADELLERQRQGQRGNGSGVSTGQVPRSPPRPNGDPDEEESVL